MEYELSGGLSPGAIVAIACNSVVGLLLLILLFIVCRACKVPSTQQKAPMLTVLAAAPEQQKKSEQKYLLFRQTLPPRDRPHDFTPTAKLSLSPARLLSHSNLSGAFRLIIPGTERGRKARSPTPFFLPPPSCPTDKMIGLSRSLPATCRFR
ncbi:hypothetical protein SKAU_G00014200 [Synaphobranchus kaupii]|uniref:Uncharacterized protein n=1 Tax=Synaphobranchus kaupii TaxID=118154 RepID=A0A9Q1GCD6_SYNKA|nr:hypothetical protein SKAU_G00014200 [Synaphobranchus kaupii]